MTLIKNISELLEAEPLDLDLQLLSSEMDTQVNDLRILTADSLTDAQEVDNFNGLLEKIESEGDFIGDFDDRTTFYFLNEIEFAAHKTLYQNYIIFDKTNKTKVNALFYSYR